MVGRGFCLLTKLLDYGDGYIEGLKADIQWRINDSPCDARGLYR